MFQQDSRVKSDTVKNTRSMIQSTEHAKHVLPRLNIYIYSFSFFKFGQEFFLSQLQYGILGTGISQSNRFVRVPSSDGGSNAPRPAVSVPHLAGIGYVG